MKTSVIIALDQGTTSSRAIAFDKNGNQLYTAQESFEQHFPENGWVEHNPSAIWQSQLNCLKKVVSQLGDEYSVKSIGITNQRETTLVWEKETGKPIYNAIVWQDRRTAAYCNQIKRKGHSTTIKEKTGLIVDAYFSATKVKWILDNVAGARDKAEKGLLCFGTVDTWLIYKLTNKQIHVTDVTNASRTMLCNIHSLEWDEELLSLFDIPIAMLPKIASSSEVYGYPTLEGLTDVPIAGIAGDQQAALFGQQCIKKGMLKNTYGTGCFLLMNTGNKPVTSHNNLLTTVAWKINDQVHYALEGSVFIGGAAVQWLRDGLCMIKNASEIEALANEVDTSDGVVVVPAFTGLGAPYWDPYARGSILGLSRGTTKAHIARATLEGIALQVHDIVKAMEQDSNIKSTELRVDGGATANNLLLQIQADVFGFKVIRPSNLETTALGAAYLAGLAVGVWKDVEELSSQWQKDRDFNPSTNVEARTNLLSQWNKAVKRSMNWIDS